MQPKLWCARKTIPPRPMVACPPKSLWCGTNHTSRPRKETSPPTTHKNTRRGYMPEGIKKERTSQEKAGSKQETTDVNYKALRHKRKNNNCTLLSARNQHKSTKGNTWGPHHTTKTQDMAGKNYPNGDTPKAPRKQKVTGNKSRSPG